MQSPRESLRYILYARKSTESEDRQAASIEDQVFEMRRLAERLKINVVEVISESRSAKKPNNRPEYTRMLEQLYNKEADAIICWKANRLARNPIEGGQISWLLQEGIIKHIQLFNGSYSPEDNVLPLQLEFGMANQYVKDLAMDTRRGMRRKAEGGWYPAGVLPAGYKHDASARATGADEIVPDENFFLMKNLWGKLLTGKYTIAAIKREGDRIGLLNRQGKPYSINNYHAMFANEFYFGKFYWKDENGVRVQQRGKHKTMITEDEFRKVRVFLGGNTNKNRIGTYTFPFRGALLCGECNRMITAEQKIQVRCTNCRHKFSIKHSNECPQCQTVLQDMNNPHIIDRTYYVCVGATKRKCSQRGSVEQGELEKQVARIVGDVTIPKGFHDWAVDAIRYLTENEAVGDGATLNAMRNRESDIERRLDKMTLMRADQEISAEHFAKITKETEVTLQDIRGEILKLHKNKIDWARIANQYLTFAETALERLNNGDMGAKKVVLESISPNLLLKDKKLSITLPKPLLGTRSAFKLISRELLGLEPEKALVEQGLFLQVEPSNPIGLRR